jgi:hypothetical protein
MHKRNDGTFALDSRTLLLTLLAFATMLIVLALPALFHNFTIPLLRLDYGNVISICSLFLTILIGVSSLLPNLRSIANTARSTHYSQLDTMYQQILSMALEKPHLRGSSNRASEPEYESYAFMVWNFLETVRDRCANDEDLKQTWAPVIAAEHAIHREWFFRETTPYLEKANPKFCLGFADFIWRIWPTPEKSSGNSARSDGAWISKSWAYRDLTDIERDSTVRDYLRGRVSDPAVQPLAEVEA